MQWFGRLVLFTCAWAPFCSLAGVKAAPLFWNARGDLQSSPQYLVRPVLNCRGALQSAVPNPGFAAQAEALSLTGQAILRELQNRTRTPGWVIHPAAAYDAYTSVALFRNLNTLALDEHPFELIIEKEYAAPLKVERHLRHRLSDHLDTADDVDREMRLRPKIMAALREIPGLRIRSVEVLFDPETIVRCPRLPPRPAVHGLIRYDFGPGTEMHTYVHIHASARSEMARDLGASRDKQWWQTLIEAMPGTPIVLAKGSQLLWDPDSSRWRSWMVKCLRHKPGVLMESAQSTHGLGEVSLRPEEIGIGSVDFYRTGKSLRFGYYEGGVRVTWF